MTAGGDSNGRPAFPRFRIAGYATLYPGGWTELVPPEVALEGHYVGETHIPPVRRLLLGLLRDAHGLLLPRGVAGVWLAWRTPRDLCALVGEARRRRVPVVAVSADAAMAWGQLCGTDVAAGGAGGVDRDSYAVDYVVLLGRCDNTCDVAVAEL